MNEKVSKANKFKEWLSEWWYLIIAIAAIVVCVAAIIIPIALAPTYSTKATVTAFGYKGVTVTYTGEYGNERTRMVDYNGSKRYQIGDTVKITIKGSDSSLFGSVKIDEVAFDDDE